MIQQPDLESFNFQPEAR